MMATTRLLTKFYIKTDRFTSITIQNVGRMSTSTNSAPSIKEQKVNVNGVNINYVRTGVGKHPVLLLPGSMEYLLFWACNLMKKLGYDEFTLLGWSDGGITSLILAAKYPENVRKMIVSGVNSYILPKEIKTYVKLRDISIWSQWMKAPPIAIYGQEYFQRVWENWVDASKHIFYNNGGDICKSDLAKIKCPTLIVYGGKNPMVLREHADFFKANVKHLKLEFFEAGAHNLHLQYADKFNLLANEFLTE